MCGIAGVYLRDPHFRVNMDAMLDTLLDEIDHRGGDATGFVALDDDGVAEWQKAACDAPTFTKHRRRVPATTRVLLAHTRWATQGLPAFVENNHPIRRGPFFVIHNGHVTNDDAMMVSSGRNRFGDVDSEAIAARLASLEDLSALAKVVEEIEGDAAVAAVDERDCGRLVLARGHASPLYVYEGRRVVVFASTRAAVVNAYTRHIGGFSERRLKYVPEGRLLEWRGKKKSLSSKIKLVERFSFLSSWSDWEDRLNEGEQWWKSSKSNGKGKDTEIITVTDTLGCDSCGTYVSWEAINYQRDDEEGVTWLLCNRCYDPDQILDPYWTDDDEEGDDEEVADADEEWISDDFEGANRHSLRLIRGLDSDGLSRGIRVSAYGTPGMWRPEV